MLRHVPMFAIALCLGCPMMDDDDDNPPEETTSPSASMTGSSSSSTTADTAESSGESSGGAVFAVSGAVTRSVPPTDDGVGGLFVAAFPTCDLTAPLLGAAIIPNADLEDDDASIPYTIEGLAAGDVFLASFLDDDGNVDPEAPGPSPGDLVLADIVGDGVLTCLEVTIDDADVEGADIDLNGIVPEPE